jgi:hypothetical protein
MRKRRHSRREFLNLSGAGLAGGWLGAATAAQAQAADFKAQDADVIVFNVKVYTEPKR